MSRVDSTVLLDASGRPITIGKIHPYVTSEGSVQFSHDPANPTHKSLAQFATWRRTKCRPRPYSDPMQQAEDCDQATHELVGEVGEIAELILTAEVNILTTPSGRAKLLDEVGDVFFCASWLGDALGYNVFVENEGHTPNQFLPEARAEETARMHAMASSAELTTDMGDELVGGLFSLGLVMSAHAGLLCNAFKKARWQQRLQPMEVQVTRIINILSTAAAILGWAGYTVEDALVRNIEKLDARFPRGYQGPGGGIRAGKGA